MKIDVIIPIYKPGQELFALLDRLRNQTVPIQNIILMNTEEKYFDELVYGTRFSEKYKNVRVYHLSKREFDHGGTRHKGVQLSDADVFICMTQDAMPVDEFLVQNLTAVENVELASEICKAPLDPRKTLEQVGLGHRLDNFPAQLSGGEQQRVAIARALAKNPKLLLCDEPTGALDYVTGKSILKLLQDTCRQTGKTVIVITHNTALTAMADRVIRVKSGQIVGNEVNPSPTPVELIEW